ncbi:MAG: hypothetical protein IKS39_09080, partial [Clostridia bacterium]|nr:hypothetical protein [Clostridia bacterium]
QPAIDEAFVREFLSRFTTCEKPTAAQKKQLIETFINSIYLFDDKVVITYNYMQQQDTVMLSDLINSIFLIDCSPRKRLILKRMGRFFALSKTRESNRA